MRLLIAIFFTTSVLLAPLSSARVRRSHAQASDQLPRGQLVEKVQTTADATQSYALYLPSYYTPARKWPVLYAFDPLARGRLPVELFRAAAEKYGWIVVGSNNSRNGPLKPSLDATAAMWNDTHARLAIDERRVYATGFSGGARAAIRLNYLCHNCLAGVVACGGGFPTDIAPDASVPFALFGVAGTNDFNYPEMKRLAETFGKFKLPHRLELFDGGHAWATPELCTQAVAWLELQAIKTGRRAGDETLLEELWRQGAAQARAAEEAKKLYDAYRSYQSLVADFKGLRETAELERKVEALRKTKEVKRALDDDDAQIGRQQKLTQELVALLQARADADRAALAMADFRKRLADLRQAARSDEDSGERRVARRALQQVFAGFYEAAADLRARRDGNAQVVANLEIAAEIATDNPKVQFELACAYAADGAKKKALAALRRAVEKGFTDANALTDSEALAPLRDDPTFKELVGSLKQKQ
jgi:dienelactone hydrolase